MPVPGRDGCQKKFCFATQNPSVDPWNWAAPGGESLLGGIWGSTFSSPVIAGNTPHEGGQRRFMW